MTMPFDQQASPLTSPPDPELSASGLPAPEPPAPEPPAPEGSAPEGSAPEGSAPVAAAEPHGPGGGVKVSRRAVLAVGVAAVPCLVGAAGFYTWLSTLTESEQVPNAEPIAAAYDATAHRWGFVVDTRRCIGCGLCVVACKTENGVPFDAEYSRTWVERHMQTADGQVYIESPEGGISGYDPATVPAQIDGSAVTDVRFVPRLCMQCENSPCTAVCPVGATYRRADGVVLIDEERCIGCGYCVVSCPYGARYIVPAGERTPRGYAGVADKCTFCYHRVTNGGRPACVEICPVGARQFGDLNDPESPVSVLLAEEPSIALRASLGTRPRVRYLGMDGETTA